MTAAVRAIVVSLLTFVFTTSVSATIPAAQRAALTDLYASTNGPGWYNQSNWNSAVGTECTWFGVTCDAGQTKVTGLDLHSNDLKGIIPASIGNLTGLQTLYLYSNGLIGSIPASLGTVASLTAIYLNQNWLTGPIPPTLGALPNLKFLNLYDNELDGSIPPELGNLPSLERLFLSWNQLTGTIPSTLGTPATLQMLELDNNLLSGSIPPALGNATNLIILSLAENSLAGTVPSELANLTKLTRLWLEGNLLDGSIPPELGNLTNLTNLHLNRNHLTGPIPSTLGNLTKLQYLWLESNAFTGELPASLSALTAITNLNLSYNGLYAFGAAKTWADSRQPAWASTQTVAPANVSAGSVTVNSVVLTWAPIAFSTYGGRFEIFSGSVGGPLVKVASTPDKSASSITLAGLSAQTSYDFSVRTVSDANVNNENTVTSEQSPTVSVTTLPIAPCVFVTSNPSAMFQEAGTAGATATFTVFNSGSTSTLVSFLPNSSIVTVSPRQITIEPNATITVTMTAISMPVGVYSSYIEISGSGVAPGLTVPVNLIVYGPPGTEVPDIVPTQVRIDISGSGQTMPGSVGFRNAGTAPATGVVASDAPWLVPDSQVPVTIAPGNVTTIPFTVNRAFAPDPASVDALMTTVRFVYPPRTTSRVTPAASSASQPGSIVVVTPALSEVVSGLPPIAYGETAYSAPWLRSLTLPRARIVADLFVSSTQFETNVGFFLLPAGAAAANAVKAQEITEINSTKPLRLGDVVGKGFRRLESSGSIHLRGSVHPGLTLEGITEAIDDARQLLLFRDTPVTRSDRGARPGDVLYLTGVQALGTLPSSLRVQEVAGTATTFAIDLLDASGRVVQSLPTQTAEKFQLVEKSLPQLGGVATIVVRNTGSGGRLVAFCEEAGASLDAGALWDSSAIYGGSRNETAVIPWVSASGGPARLHPVRRGGDPESAGGEKTTLAIHSSAGAQLRVDLVRGSAVTTRPMTLAAGETRLWSDVYSQLFETPGGGEGTIVVARQQGEFAAAAWIEGRNGAVVTNVMTAPVVPASSALTAGTERRFTNVIDASAASIQSNVAAAMTPELGLVETSGNAATVEVTVSFGSDRALGAVTVKKTYQLAANESRVIADVIGSVAGASRRTAPDLFDATVTVKVSSGAGRVIPYLLTKAHRSGDHFIRVR